MNSLGSIPQPFPFSLQEQDDPMDGSQKEINKNFEADDISMKDDTEDVSSLDSDNDETTLETTLNLKNEAAEKIKSSDFISARNINKKVVSSLLKHSKKKTTAAEPSENNELQLIEDTLKAVYLNLALCHLKLEEWNEAISATSSVLKKNKYDVKALYRRSQAYQNLGLLDEACKDLTLTSKLTKNNTEMVKELNKVRKLLKEAQIKEKQRYTGLFDKTQGLYKDKKERPPGKENEKIGSSSNQQNNPCEETNKSRRKEASTEPTSSDKSKKSINRDDKQIKTTSVSSNNTSKEAISMELDEEDQKIVDETKKMGYCYFNRTKTPNTSVPSETHLPKKLETTTAGTATEASSKSGKSLSSWNAAGTTYEERDCTLWGTETLKKLLLGASGTHEDNVLKATDVNFLNKDCQIVVLRSTKRYLYDFSCEVSWELERLSNGGNERIKGTINLVDISSTVSSSSGGDGKTTSKTNFPEWLRNCKVKITEKPKNENFSLVLETCVLEFQKSLLEKVQQFELEYKAYA